MTAGSSDTQPPGDSPSDDERAARFRALMPSDFNVYPVTQVPAITVLNKDTQDRIHASHHPVQVHDTREFKNNPEFEKDMDHGRFKLNDGKPLELLFADESVCSAPQSYFEMKLARVDGKFLNVSAMSRNLDQRFSPDTEHWFGRMETLTEPDLIEGRSAVLMGIGRASNYYHWFGEQMPRIELLRQHIDLAELDTLVVFARELPSFISESIALLFPEFRGRIHNVTRHSALLEEGYFFVPAILGRSDGSASPGKGAITRHEDGTLTRETWGSIERISKHVDVMLGNLAEKGRSRVLCVSRRNSRVRHWINEDDLLGRLASTGVACIFAEEHSVAEQAEMFRSADIVIAQHGAGLANIMFCRPGTRVIEVTTRNHISRAWDFAKIGVARQLEYHVVVADAVQDDDDARWAKVPAPPSGRRIRSSIRTSTEANDRIEQLTRDRLAD
ncbi:MAG: glycosyltransferase family 61 protein [Pseudomonadota bacterium]